MSKWVGNWLSIISKKKEELKMQKSKSKQVEPKLTLSQHYGVGTVLVVGVTRCGLGY